MSLAICFVLTPNEPDTRRPAVGAVRFALNARSCPIRAHVRPPCCVVTGQGGVARFSEKRKARRSAAALNIERSARCRIEPYLIKAAPLRGTAGPASAPGSALGGPPGARRATHASRTR